MKNSTILITGGTGSFGKSFIPMTLEKFSPKKIIVYSRDEMKQFTLSEESFKNDSRVKFVIGDVRDKNRLSLAFQNIDLVNSSFDDLKDNINISEDMSGMSVGSGHKRSVDSGAGMTKKGVNAYKRRNPGSKLQTAVTTPPSKLKAGSKPAKRRKAFCSRSRSWTGERGKAARRRWNC